MDDSLRQHHCDYEEKEKYYWQLPRSELVRENKNLKS